MVSLRNALAALTGDVQFDSALLTADGGFAGKAKVLLTNNATGEGYVRVGITADTGEEAGKGVWEALPTSPFATDKHFQEIGHNLETTGAPGLCLCSIHFN